MVLSSVCTLQWRPSPSVRPPFQVSKISFIFVTGVNIFLFDQKWAKIWRNYVLGEKNDWKGMKKGDYLSIPETTVAVGTFFMKSPVCSRQLQLLPYLKTWPPYRRYLLLHPYILTNGRVKKGFTPLPQNPSPISFFNKYFLTWKGLNENWGPIHRRLAGPMCDKIST